MHRFSSRSAVGASRWLATSGSLEQFGWQNRSHTGQNVPRMRFGSATSGEPPADPYEYVEEAVGTRLQVTQAVQ